MMFGYACDETRELMPATITYAHQLLQPTGLLNDTTRYFVNPTGRFVIGGPHGNTGLTGRKIIVDTCGGMGRHGGGAFSGANPSKVDRSATCMANTAFRQIHRLTDGEDVDSVSAELASESRYRSTAMRERK